MISAGAAMTEAAMRFADAVCLSMQDLGVECEAVDISQTGSTCRVLMSGDMRILVVAGDQLWRVLELVPRLTEPEGTAAVIPVVLLKTALQVGPVLVAGGDCCWVCWLKRLRQHGVDAAGEQTKTMDDWHIPGLAVAESIFHEPSALLAAGYLASFKRLLHERRGGSGQCRRVDLPTRKATHFRVLGVHGCQRCGLGRSESDRSVSELRTALRFLWQAD